MVFNSPRVTTINTDAGISLKLAWNPAFVSAANSVLSRGGELQKVIDATILESIEPYMPFDTGELRNSGYRNTVIGSGKLVWRTPYARYLYHGLLMVDPVYGKGAFHDPVTGRYWSRRGVKKIVSDTPLKFRGGGKRGARWADRWVSDNLEAFEKNLNRKAGELLRR